MSNLQLISAGNLAAAAILLDNQNNWIRNSKQQYSESK